MKRPDQQALYILILFFLSSCNSPSAKLNAIPQNDTLRFASFNVSMYRQGKDSLRNELKSADSEQIKHVAAIIRAVKPDVLALMEFDYDETGESLDLFQHNYLNVSLDSLDPIDYPYAYQVPSNTGLLSTTDINGDGEISLPQDAYGFGRHEGQYAFALLSKFPIQENQIRSFQTFLWKDMPDPNFPVNPDGSQYYPDSIKEMFRISSKNHIDIPLKIDESTIHVILAHPTPPVFDGPEDKNGCRNYDELRLLVDYVSNESYMVDDKGTTGGLAAGSSFVIMGDLNADPKQGDAKEGAISQLLDLAIVNQDVSSGKLAPKSQGTLSLSKPSGDSVYYKTNTGFSGLRLDYVLPSANLNVIESGVFLPLPSDPMYPHVRDKNASDHLLVWVDIKF